MEFLYCSRYQVHKLSGDKLPESLKRSGTFPTVLEPWMENIQIKSPSEGSKYFKYPGYHSIILLAVVDAHHRVIYFDGGANGRAGDTGLFRDSGLHEGLEKKNTGHP